MKARALIVGAGPAGAALAFLLARRGIDVTLLERHGDFEREFRGEVLMPSALEAIDQMGLGEPFAALPQTPLRRARLYLYGREIFSADLSAPQLGTRMPTWVPQPAFLELLVEQASAFASFRFERGASARDLLVEGDRVVGLRVHTAAGERELRADLVIGADGRGSLVRRRSGVAVRRDRAAMDIVWCKLPLPESMRSDQEIRGYLGNGHVLIAAPTPDKRLQLGWVIRKGRFGELRARGVPEWIDELARHVSPDLSEHLRAHRGAALRPFLLDVVADRVAHWSAPGMLLIGDAAHTMSPVGAQGLNIALRDAVVAANQLVPVLERSSDPHAIDAACARVERERLPEVSAIQRLQALPPHVILSTSWWSKLALRLLPLLAIGATGGGAVFRRLAYGVTEVKLRV